MARPTLGTVSGEITASGAITIDATTRALWIVLLGGSNTTFTHGTQTVSVGGKAGTLHESRSQVQVHQCGYYIEDLAGRTNNVLTLGGTVAYGVSINQYRARVFCINHPTHKVLLAAEGGNNANANGGTITVALAQGGGVESLVLLSGNTSSASGGMTGNTGMTSPTNLYAAVAGPSGTAHHKRADRSNETGSTTPGFTMGAGSNTQRTVLATAWKQGAALAPRNASRAWALGALPALPMGLVAARAIPVGARV